MLTRARIRKHDRKTLTPSSSVCILSLPHLLKHRGGVGGSRPVNARRHDRVSIGTQVFQSPYNRAIARNLSQYNLPPPPCGFLLQDDHAAKLIVARKKVGIGAVSPMAKIKSSVRVGLYLVKMCRSRKHLRLVRGTSRRKPVATHRDC
jgi:hypothetical protein